MFVGVSNYQQFGGQHWDTAAMRNLLAHADVVAPHTNQPLSEGMCLGIAGGIGCGYSFSPAIPKYDMQFGNQLASRPLATENDEKYFSRLLSCGSGLSVVGRYRVYVTTGEYQANFFHRLGATANVEESGGTTAGLMNLNRALTESLPALVWCAPTRASQLGWSGTCGNYSLVVYGMDEESGTAFIADRANQGLSIRLSELTWLRSRVGSHKNRVLTIRPPGKLTSAIFKKAIWAGISDCLEEMSRPKMKTYGLPGLMEWSKIITSPSSPKGWPRVYPGGRIYLALRDTFDCIETAGTGGGLFRPMYAQFLAEAAAATGKKTLAACAKTYHQLGSQWSDLAEAALPDKVRAFRQTKELLRTRLALFEQQGDASLEQRTTLTDQLRQIEVEQRRSPALDENQAADVLIDLQAKIAELHDAERAAVESLKKAVGRVTA